MIYGFNEAKIFHFFSFTKWLKVLKPSILLVGIYGIEPDIYLINFKKKEFQKSCLTDFYNQFPRKKIFPVFFLEILKSNIIALITASVQRPLLSEKH